MKRWQGRAAIVTGASSGIGAAVALDLANNGMRVIAAARRQEALNALSAQGPAGAIVPVQTDLRSEQSILALFAAAREQLGGVDVLINNAGLGFHEPLTSGDTERWREMLEVNVLALCVCTREAIADMRRRQIAGHIVHVSSMSAHRVPEGSGMYSATKFAVRSLTEGLRQELRAQGSGIRISALSPGFVRTEFAAKYHGSEDAAAHTYDQYPVLEPADVAASVRYVLEQPEHVQIHDVLMRPTRQPS